MQKHPWLTGKFWENVQGCRRVLYLPLMAWRASTRNIDYHPLELSCCLDTKFGIRFKAFREVLELYVSRWARVMLFNLLHGIYVWCSMESSERCYWNRHEALSWSFLIFIFAFWLTLLFCSLNFPTEESSRWLPLLLSSSRDFLFFFWVFFVLFSCYLCWIMMNQVSCYKSCSYVTLFPCLRDKILPTSAISFLPFA